MSLRIDFNGQLLMGDIGNVDVLLDSGLKLPIVIARRSSKVPHTIPDPNPSDRLGFFILIRHLPGIIQNDIRSDINRKQKEIYDAAPAFKDAPRRRLKPRVSPSNSDAQRIPIAKPAATVDIQPDYALVVAPHHVLDGFPCLRVGKKLVLRPRKPFENFQYPLENIASFTIR